jgi:predicted enzyme related to lactoylglutathione lyase
MFYKIGFWVLLAALIGCGGLWLNTSSMKLDGGMSWVDIYSDAPADTIAFLDKTFGIKVVDTTKDDFGEYNVIKTPGQLFPFAGIMGLPEMPGAKAVPGAMIYLTVKDYAASAEKMKAAGAIPRVENMVAGGMLFGVYEIPGRVAIGIAQYENIPGDD